MVVSRLFRAVVMGAPGSGKGTISSRIVRDFGIKHLSSGDLLRAQILDGTVLGTEASEYIERGELVPDDLVIKLLLSELQTRMQKFNWLLDGFPRTLTQAEALSSAFTLTCVLNLDVPDEVIIDRIKGRWLHAASGRIYHTQFNPPKAPGFDNITGEPLVQRDDDKPETVKARLESYNNQTSPVLQYYRNKGILQQFSGTESNEIWPRVYKYLCTLIPPLDSASSPNKP